MPSRRKRYLYAVLSGLIAAPVRLALDRIVGYHHPYAAFYIAALWSAWYGGFWPAVVTIGIGAIAAVVFALPVPYVGGQGATALVGFEFYFIVSLTGAILFEAQRRAEQVAAANARVARERLDELEREAAQRRRAEDVAGQAQEQFRLAFEHAPVGICKIDLDGALIEMNPQLCAILGHTREELMGRNLGEVIGLDNEEVDYLRLRRGSIPFFSHQTRYVRSDGAEIWTEMTVSLVHNARGAPEFGVGIIQDITSRKRSEEQIREAQKLESIGLLAGGIAHDFNNLLTGVLGNASLALKSIPPESDARRMLESVVAAAERAADLTGQLLAYAGKGAWLSRDLDLSKIVRASVDLVRDSLPSNVEIRLHLAEGLPRFAADPGQIRQVVNNLIVNAAESIGTERPGRITVSTGIERFDQNHLPAPAVGKLVSGQYVTLRVEDNGPGIAPAILQQIFDPFFTTKFLGRGLGLAAVSGIVRARKGAVVVSSVPERGSTFTVLFPVERAETRKSASEDAPDGVTHAGF